MNIKQGALVLTAGAVIGVLAMSYFQKTGVQIDKEKINNETVTEIKEIKGKDGTVEIITKIVEKERGTRVTQTPVKAKWKASVGVSTSLHLQPIYKLQIEHRFGDSPLWVGAYGETNGTIGVLIGMEF